MYKPVTAIDVHNQALAGTIPPEIGLLDRLQKLYLFANKLTSTIPTSLSNLSALTDLILDQNHLVDIYSEQLLHQHLHFNWKPQCTNFTELGFQFKILSKCDNTVPKWDSDRTCAIQPI